MLLAAIGLSSCGGSSGTDVIGAGSTAQGAAQEVWIERVENDERESSPTYAYEPVGSGQGRRRFIAGDVAYAATDTPLAGEELQRAVERCEPGQLVEVPVYLSRIAVVFKEGKATRLDLASETLAKIFSGAIARWDDPAIRRDNRDNPTAAKQLSGPITVVYPAGKSGTTANFTEYLSEAAPGVWSYGSSETWPLPEVGIPVAAAKVEATVRGREGSIAFVDASQVGELGTVAIKIGEGSAEHSVPTTRGTSIGVLEESPEAKALEKSPYMFPIAPERPEARRGSYPVVLISYMIACTRYDSAEEAAAVKTLLAYAVSSGQGFVAERMGADLLREETQKQGEAAARAIE